jgi:hypothetical protein
MSSQVLYVNPETKDVIAAGNIIANGNVGIGTTQPNHKLHVIGPSIACEYATGGTLALVRPSGGYLRITQDTNGNNYIQSGLTLTSGSTSPLIFGSLLGGNEWMRVHSDGNIGIGTAVPFKPLHVHVNVAAGGIAVSNSPAYNTGASTQLNSFPNNTTFMPSPAGNIIYTYWKDTNGTKYFYSVAASAALFTGQHMNYANSNIDAKIHEGLIVVSTGTYKSYINDGEVQDYMFINECLPTISISSCKRQKTVFGVVTSAPNEVKKRDDGSIIFDYETYDEFEMGIYGRIRVNSVGEGGMWVCNDNGDLENGDFITTSDLPGYGMKQNEDMMMNFTVAKITCNCNFSNMPSWIQTRTVEHNAISYICAFVGCTYHCG